MIAASLITYTQAIVLGLLQGVTELFPISSLGRVILPSLLGWNIHQNDQYFLTFLVATHLATAIVLLLFFWRELGADRRGHRPVAARARDRGGRHGRQARLAAGLADRFLMRYFETRTLIPFAIYCLAAGTACAIYFVA